MRFQNSNLVPLGIMPIIHGSCRRKSIGPLPSCLKLAVEAGIIHVGNDARLTAALAEGIAGESSALGEYADELGEPTYSKNRL